MGVIIFSIGFNYLIAPILTKNENLNREIKINRARLKKYLQLLSQKDYIRNKYNNFFNHLKDSAAKEDTLVSVLSELENLAKASNIRIIDIRPQAPKSMALYKEVLIDLRTEGAMEGYLKFIYNIENSLPPLRIKRLQLNAKPNTSALEGNFSVSQLAVLE